MSSLLASACNMRYASNGENQYMQAQSSPSLVIPPPLNGANISHFYDLPPQTQNADVSILPPSVS